MSAQHEKQNVIQQNEIRQSVERAVTEALKDQLPQLQSRIVEQVQQVLDALPTQALPAESSEAPAAAHPDSNALVEAVSSIHAGSTQKEILRALLDAGSGYCSRIALFVVKAGAASGWQSRGFGDDEAVKDFALDLTAGPGAHTYQKRIPTPGNNPEMGAPEAEPAGEVVEGAGAQASAVEAPAAARDPLAGLSPEDADAHRKAQRFARLLVDEIKLYNQAKVAEGRRHKDLYDRLKEDIDKSRGTFQKRYGNTAAATGDYFHCELLRSLAEDDISIMGSNFHR